MTRLYRARCCENPLFRGSLEIEVDDVEKVLVIAMQHQV